MDSSQLVAIVEYVLSINQYLTALIILVLYFFFSKLAVMIIEKIVLRLTAKTETTLDDEIVKVVRAPISWLILLIGFNLFFVEIWKQYSWVNYIQDAIYSLMVFIFMSTIIKILNILITEFGNLLAKKNREKHLDDQLVKLMHQFATVILYVIAVLWILSLWGVQIGPFLAGLGIGGIAVAFALQSTLANLFGGVGLIFDKALKVGDTLKLDSGEIGEVYEVGLRSTRIKTPTNEIIVVPNGKLMDSKITNYNQPDRTVRVDIDFGVAYGSGIDKVKQVALDCLEGEKYVLSGGKNEPEVRFLALGDSSLSFRLMFWVDDLDNRWPVHQSVITKLYNRLNKNKIGIPFPQSEVWLHKMKK